MERRALKARDRWEQALRASDVVGPCLTVLLVAATYGNRDGTAVRVGVATLATVTGLGESTVRRHLSTARAAGWLTTVSRGHRRGNGDARPTEYRLTIPGETALPLSTGAVEDTRQPLTCGAVEPVSTAHPDHLNRSPEAPQLLAMVSAYQEDQEDQGGTGTVRTYPRQCDAHQDAPHDAACGPCKRAREAQEARDVVEARRRAERARSGPRCPVSGHEHHPAATCGLCRSEYLETGRFPEGSKHRDAPAALAGVP